MNFTWDASGFRAGKLQDVRSIVRASRFGCFAIMVLTDCLVVEEI